MAVRAALTALIALGVLGSFDASAEVVYTTESPRSGALELKLGSYRPSVGKAYDDTFDGSMLLFTAEYDYYLWKKVGALGVGFSAGYAEKYGKATAVGTGDATAVNASLHVVPLQLLALYRFDYAALEWGIPFVPYLKGGIAYVPWWSGTGDDTETVGGQEGRGASWGFAGTAGLSFLMDVLDRRMARDFDSGLGVNHTYLFAEVTFLSANDFGGDLDLSDNFFQFGLAFEF